MGISPDETPVAPDKAEAERKGRPPRGQADDGRDGGVLHRGYASTAATPGVGRGDNAQTGRPSGAEDERNAPGIATDKKADDTK